MKFTWIKILFFIVLIFNHVSMAHARLIDIIVPGDNLISLAKRNFKDVEEKFNHDEWAYAQALALWNPHINWKDPQVGKRVFVDAPSLAFQRKYILREKFRNVFEKKNSFLLTYFFQYKFLSVYALDQVAQGSIPYPMNLSFSWFHELDGSTFISIGTKLNRSDALPVRSNVLSEMELKPQMEYGASLMYYRYIRRKNIVFGMGGDFELIKKYHIEDLDSAPSASITDKRIFSVKLEAQKFFRNEDWQLSLTPNAKLFRDFNMGDYDLGLILGLRPFDSPFEVELKLSRDKRIDPVEVATIIGLGVSFVY